MIINTAKVNDGWLSILRTQVPQSHLRYYYSEAGILEAWWLGGKGIIEVI